MSTVRANIYSKTSGADIGTLFNPYTGTAAVSTGIYTISGGAYVDLNTRFAKYTGANGTAEATGILCLSGGVYFDLNTRFEKYGVALNITYTGSPTYTTYTSNGYNVIVITAASSASINFSQAKTVNYVVVGGGGGGGSAPGLTGDFGYGAGGGAGGKIITGSISLTANTSYTLTVGTGGAATTSGGSTRFGTINASGGLFGGNTTLSARGSGGVGSSGGGSGGAGMSGSANPAVNGSAGTTMTTTITFTILGTTYTRLAGGGGGGGGSILTTNFAGGGGGAGGGGSGATGNGASGASGTGGGGGGAGGKGVPNTGGAGGHGVIVLYYL